jgi:hypothetical protein
MTIPVIKIKVLPKPTIRGKMDVRFPASVSGEIFIQVGKQAGHYTIFPDYRPLAQIFTFDPAQQFIAVQDATGEWGRVSIAGALSNPSVSVRVVTEAGDIAVGPNVQLLVMNRAADESPSNIILPDSSTKFGRVKIVDFKGNAGTFPHTIKTQGNDEFQGGLTEWQLDGDGASVALDPIPGVGYAV